MPLPEPLAPDAIVMNPLLLTAVQLQPACVVTVTHADPPAAPKPALVGLIEKEQAPAQSAGTLVAAVCVVPSLPTADTPMP